MDLRNKYTGKETYTNLFLILEYTEAEINQKLNDIVKTIFYGSEEEKFYYEVDDMAYVLDTGNHDVRTEGMSYAMMAFVQLDKENAFNKIWKFVKTYMLLTDGPNKGYFAWSVLPSGEKLANGPAPDGEEFFAMALFFAAHRWGNKEGIFNYEKEARELLSICIHKGESDDIGSPMWEPSNKLIKFVPELNFSDPSYHLPHFYELFALWADERDRMFWKEAAECSRDYIVKSCNPLTGLAPEYADYEGNPKNWNGHDCFFSDSYRVAANIGLYHEWFGDDGRLCQCINRLQLFFKETAKENWDYIYRVDGTKMDEKILHPTALIATNAMGSLATDNIYSKDFVKEFYETPLRKGDRRYYDNFLYLFSFLALSGNYRIW